MQAFENKLKTTVKDKLKHSIDYTISKFMLYDLKYYNTEILLLLS